MTEDPLEWVCEHVGYARYMVSAPTPRGMVDIRCPCCGLRAYQDPGDLLDEGPPCPYCNREPVLA